MAAVTIQWFWNSIKCLCCHFPTFYSEWRVLKKCGLLEEGMANHSSILATRTPWTVWKGNQRDVFIDYDKEYSHGSGWLRFGRGQSLCRRGGQGAERPEHWTEISKNNDGKSGGKTMSLGLNSSRNKGSRLEDMCEEPLGSLLTGETKELRL